MNSSESDIRTMISGPRTPIIQKHFSFEALVVVFCCTISSVLVAADSPRAIYDAAKRATFVIETYDSKGIPLGMGTGFAVRSNFVASNCHVIRGAHRVTARSLDSNESLGVQGVAGSNPQADLVLLQIEQAATPLLIDTNVGWSVGDPVFALGNPRGLEGTFSAGMISAKREIQNIEFLQITAPISPGSSGGPILSSNGNVIGVATAFIKDAQNLNFAVSAKHLIALLSEKQQLDSFAVFSARNDYITQKETLTSPQGAGVVVRDFQWDTGWDRQAGSFTFSVFNGLSRPICRAVVVLSFLNPQFEPVDTKLITVRGIILPHSATRCEGSVDRSVCRINNSLYESTPLGKFGADMSKTYSFKLGTNEVVVKHKGSEVSGWRPIARVNGRSVSVAEYHDLFEETGKNMRVMRVLSFEYAD